MPKRLWRGSIKSTHLPAGAVYIGPHSEWANPFLVVPASSERGGPQDMWAVQVSGLNLVRFDDRLAALADAVDRYRRAVWHEGHQAGPEARVELAGKDLVCWCPLDEPCHADVLIEIANRPAGGGSGVQ